MLTRNAFVIAAGILSSVVACARDIGSVDTEKNLIGSNHKIKIETFDDPKVQGVSCFLSRPVAGGISGALGLVEEKSDVSIACRQTGPIIYKEPIGASQNGEEVFNEKRSPLFKSLHVTRFFDAASKSLVYLTWSDKLFSGSPKNSLSAVTPQPWGTELPGAPKLMK